LTLLWSKIIIFQIMGATGHVLAGYFVELSLSTTCAFHNTCQLVRFLFV